MASELEMIRQLPERNVPEGIKARLRKATIECAVADVHLVLTLDLDPEEEALARAAEKTLLELYCLVRVK